jgi:hypothetical protein
MTVLTIENRPNRFAERPYFHAPSFSHGGNDVHAATRSTLALKHDDYRSRIVVSHFYDDMIVLAAQRNGKGCVCVPIDIRCELAHHKGEILRITSKFMDSVLGKVPRRSYLIQRGTERCAQHPRVVPMIIWANRAAYWILPAPGRSLAHSRVVRGWLEPR